MANQGQAPEPTRKAQRSGGAGLRWGTVGLGSLLGVRVSINIGALAIMAVLVVLLATVQFPLRYPGQRDVAYAAAAVVSAVLFLVSILGHELAHAVAARRRGLEVEGITLWLLGGVSQLRGEPRTPRADFTIAVVGPLTSLALGVGFAGLALGGAALSVHVLVVAVPAYLAAANLLLAIFNVIPAAPLDGGRILRAAVWRATGDRTRAAVVAARAGRVFGYLLIVAGLAQVLVQGSMGGLWLVLLGWFMVNAARVEESQSVAGRRLLGVRVADVMTPQPVAGAGEEPVAAFIDRVVLHRPYSTYPLTDSLGRLAGLVTLNRIRAVPPERRPWTQLAEIADPADGVTTARPDEPLLDLLSRVTGRPDGHAVVIDHDGRVLGIISPRDISHAINIGDLRSRR